MTKKCLRIDKTKNYIRCRKQNPKKFDKRSFRIKPVSKKTKIVLACPKGKYNAKKERCKGKLKLQSVLKKISKSSMTGMEFNRKHWGEPRWS